MSKKKIVYKSERKRNSLASIPEKQHTNNPLLHNNPLPLNPSVTLLRHVLSSVESGSWSTPGIFYFKSERLLWGELTLSFLRAHGSYTTQHHPYYVLVVGDCPGILVSVSLSSLRRSHRKPSSMNPIYLLRSGESRSQKAASGRYVGQKRPNTEGNMKEIPEQN